MCVSSVISAKLSIVSTGVSFRSKRVSFARPAKGERSLIAGTIQIQRQQVSETSQRIDIGDLSSAHVQRHQLRQRCYDSSVTDRGVVQFQDGQLRQS